MNRVCLQINLSPFDRPMAKALLPLQINTFGSSISKIFLTYDRNPRKIRGRWAKEGEKFLKELQNFQENDHRIEILDVDYNQKAKTEIYEFFSQGRKIPIYDFRGAPIYPYLYGLFHASAEYVLHLDSDMFLGGSGKQWIEDSIDLFERIPNIFALNPLPGPPHPQKKLIKNNPAIRTDIGERYYSYDTLSTRLFFSRKADWRGFLSKPTIPSLPRILYALWKGYPPFLPLEELISKNMKKRGLIRIDFSRDPYFFTLHPLHRSEQFLQDILKIWEKVQEGPYPQDQLGYYNFTESFWDWGKKIKTKK